MDLVDDSDIAPQVCSPAHGMVEKPGAAVVWILSDSHKYWERPGVSGK